LRVRFTVTFLVLQQQVFIVRQCHGKAATEIASVLLPILHQVNCYDNR
jgi:hypothetical protein